MNRRKGTPCACESDPCRCGSKKGIQAINNVSPDANGDIILQAGTGITIVQTGDNTLEISFDGTFPGNPMIFKGTVGSGGTVSVLPTADMDNIGWTYIAIEDATVPVTYQTGDTLISNGYTWVVIPSGDDPVDWSQILNTPNTIGGYGITDAYTKSEVDTLDNGKVDKITTAGVVEAYTHNGSTQGSIEIEDGTTPDTIPIRDANGRMQTADPSSGATDKSVVNANWVSQTGDSAPNNLVHRTGNEMIAGTKTYTSPIYRTYSGGGQNGITVTGATGNEYIYTIYDVNGKERGYINHQCVMTGDLATRFIIALQSPNYSTTDQTGSIASLQIELIDGTGRLRIIASTTKGDGTTASQTLVNITPS